jgi:hypothetical protein
MELSSSSRDRIEQVQRSASSFAEIRNIPATNVSINIVAGIRGTVAVKHGPSSREIVI